MGYTSKNFNTNNTDNNINNSNNINHSDNSLINSAINSYVGTTDKNFGDLIINSPHLKRIRYVHNKFITYRQVY